MPASSSKDGDGPCFKPRDVSVLLDRDHFNFDQTAWGCQTRHLDGGPRRLVRLLRGAEALGPFLVHPSEVDVSAFGRITRHEDSRLDDIAEGEAKLLQTLLQ